MQQAMAYWGPDGTRIWHSDPVGMGFLSLHSTPESIFEIQPALSGDKRLAITASARLDNREYLCSCLDIPGELRASTPDSVIIMKSYEKWGEDCVNHLLGDWSFALWDGRKKQLFIARDQNGVSGVFYYVSENFCAFSSNVKGLLSLSEIPRRLNEHRLAEILVIYSDPRHDKYSQLYKDIQILPPAHSLKISAEDLALHEYWRLEDTQKIRFATDEEYVEAFLEQYYEAVRCRLRSSRKIGVSLSSGFDSGSVLALASKAARVDNRDINAFTSIPVYDTRRIYHGTRIGNEWDLAHRTAEKSVNVNHSAVEAKEVSPLQGLQRFLNLHEQASHAAANFYWLFAMYAQAQQNGVGVILDGQRGNATVSWNGGGFPVMRFIRSGNLAGGWKWIRDWRTAHRVSWSKAMKSQIIRPWLPIIRYARLSLIQQKDPWLKYSAINPLFARRLNILPFVDQMYKESATRRFGDPEREHYAVYNAARTWIGAVAQGSGAGYNLEIRDPTIDQRVVKFCFSIPVEQYQNAGEDRWLIRRAMRGLLPQEVLTNQMRGKQSADIARRTAAHPDEMERILNRFESSAVVGEYLNLPGMRRVWRSIQDSVNINNSSQCGSILLKGALVGLFLLRFSGEESG
jgi:asparagine synthase (glutamine-hydrolysing)